MRRRRWMWTVLLLVFVAVAIVTHLCGWDDLSLALELCWVMLAVGEVVVDWRARRRGPSSALPEITPGQADVVRGERDRAGEIAAIKRLRTLHPALSLLDAQNLVRDL